MKFLRIFSPSIWTIIVIWSFSLTSYILVRNNFTWMIYSWDITWVTIWLSGFIYLANKYWMSNN